MKTTRTRNRSGAALLGIIGGGLALALFSVKKAGGSLLFFPGNITGVSLDGINPVVRFQIRAQNTSSTDFKLNSIAANVYANNTLIGNVSSFETVAINSNTQTIITLNAILSASAAVAQLVQYLTSGFGQVELTVVGNANASNYQIPLNLSYKVNG